MNLKIINPITYPGWDDLLLSNPGYSFFHSSCWAKVLHESYKYEPIYLTVIKNNKLSVLMPFLEVKNFVAEKKGVSLPFTDKSEPIITDDISPQEFLDILIEYGKKTGWKSIEIRGGESLFLESSPSSHYYGHTLDLSQGEEQLFSHFRDNNKRNIKKAVRNGIKVDLCNTMESVKQFYRLNCITRKMHGLPPQPGFFLERYMTILFQGILVLLHLLHIIKKLLLGLFIFILERRQSINTELRTGNSSNSGQIILLCGRP